MSGRPEGEALRGLVQGELRTLVREVLREILPTAGTGTSATAAAPARTEDVIIRNDADLAAFVARLMRLFEDPATRDAISAGRHRFRLAATTQGEGVAATSHVDKGVLSEAKVVALAREGGRIVLGKGVVVTPLARDKARQLGVRIERKT